MSNASTLSAEERAFSELQPEEQTQAIASEMGELLVGFDLALEALGDVEYLLSETTLYGDALIGVQDKLSVLASQVGVENPDTGEIELRCRYSDRVVWSLTPEQVAAWKSRREAAD